jgi:integrase
MSYDRKHYVESLFSTAAPISNRDAVSAPPIAPPVSAAAALKQICTWTDITAGRRRELASALNTVARVAGVPADLLLLTPHRIRDQAVTKSASAWGLKPASKSNALSRLRQVLVRLEIIDDPKNCLSSDWAELYSCCDNRLRMSLVLFLKYCSASRICPNDVNDESLAAFENWTSNRTINAAPRDMASAARRAWNRAAAQIESWPKKNLALKSMREQLLLPFGAFPPSLEADIQVYAKKMAGVDLDDIFGIDIASEDEKSENGDSNNMRSMDIGKPTGCRPLRPLTIETKLQTLRVIVNALHRSGTPVDEITDLSCCVTPLAKPKAILTTLMKENGGKTSPKIGHAAEMLRQIAKYRVLCSVEHVAQIATWVRKVRVSYPEMTRRNRMLLEQITPERRLALRHLPKALLCEANRYGPCYRAAICAQRAAMIEILCKLPLRLGNLRGLRLDQHLVRPDPKSRKITAIVIPASETKNRRQLTYPVTETTSEVLDIWICNFRPLIAEPGNLYFFSGRALMPMTRAGIRDSIKTITHDRIGVPVNPHAFRHLAAETFLEAFPTAYESVRRLLGHASIQTTTNSYCQSESKAAIRIFDAILETDADTLAIKRTPPNHKKSSSVKKRGNNPSHGGR